ncbi:MAG: helix-turn-helix domain-containing protein [Candidatus Gastranaerophilales bacterium]|nr:helix-turn-helix domain-containing protein [Candidatus Gastranaerophilales bacterium]
MKCQKNIGTITYMEYTSDKDNLKLFGEVVRNIRVKKSSSLNNLAFSRGGVTSATLSRIENGLVDFKFSTLLKLSYTLDIPLAELFKEFKYKNIIEE